MRNWTIFFFSPDTLVKISKKLKPKLISGPDGYSPFFLKQIISAIAAPLCMVYQCFMSVGIIPLDWKSAIIVLIFKKGISSDPFVSDIAIFVLKREVKLQLTN